jgi:4a-hydroxytetrahydrobiopterin dehydratase
MAALTPEQLLARDGVRDWTASADGATATFATGSFARGVEFIVRIGRLAEAANHHPDVDLRYPTVAVHLVTHDEGSAITEHDVSLAQQITAAARSLGISAA